MVAMNELNLGEMVDLLGDLMAQKTEITKREEEIKALLKQSGVRAVEGSLFRATISKYEVSKVDYKAICEKLQPPAQLLMEHTTKTEQVSVRVMARNGKGC